LKISFLSLFIGTNLVQSVPIYKDTTRPLRARGENINGSTKDMTLGLMGTGRGAWDAVTLGVVHLALGLIYMKVGHRR
jgi:hypothetical protein